MLQLYLSQDPYNLIFKNKYKLHTSPPPSTHTQRKTLGARLDTAIIRPYEFI